MFTSLLFGWFNIQKFVITDNARLKCSLNLTMLYSTNYLKI